MSRRAHASPKASGNTVESITIQHHPLRSVPDSEASWHDAVTTGLVTPSPSLLMGSICLVESGTEVEIKATQGLRSNGSRQSPGSWLFQQRCHERLLDAAGVYWLTVYRPAGSTTDILSELVVPASIVDELLAGRWYDAPQPVGGCDRTAVLADAAGPRGGADAG